MILFDIFYENRTSGKYVIFDGKETWKNILFSFSFSFLLKEEGKTSRNCQSRIL